MSVEVNGCLFGYPRVGVFPAPVNISAGKDDVNRISRGDCALARPRGVLSSFYSFPVAILLLLLLLLLLPSFPSSHLLLLLLSLRLWCSFGFSSSPKC